MKRGAIFVLLLLLMMMLAGCEKKEQEIAGYQIYCVDETGTKLESEHYTPKAAGGEELIQELIGQLAVTPVQAGHRKAVPDGIGITSAVCTEKNLKVDFNGTYSEMDHVTEVFCRAAVVKTLVQVEEVDTVEFTINGQELADAQGAPLGVMSADSFIDTRGDGINSYQFGALTLYFADESGKKLVKEMRNVHYSSNTSLERVVVEELLEGPQNTKLRPVIAPGVKIIDVKVENQVCTVNLDDTFNQENSEITALPETVIYGIVNTLCDNCQVSTVQIQINGKSSESYQEQIDISKPLGKSEALIQTTEKPKPSVGVDPSLQQTQEETK